MLCPKHKIWLKKARLDVYWCDECQGAWLIHKLSTYKTFEEASKTDIDKILRRSFLTMPILPIEFPPATEEDIKALIVPPKG